jgi:hypothetical protein
MMKLMAGAKGLEPSAFCVTGRRYNQLNYAPADKFPLEIGLNTKGTPDWRQEKRFLIED